MNRRRIIIIVVVVLVLCCFGAAVTAILNQGSNGEGDQGQVEVAEVEDAAEPEPEDTQEPTEPPATDLPPTDTPQPTNTPTVAELLNAVIADALGRGNRDVERVAKASKTLDVIDVEWAINDNLSEDMIRDGVKLDIVDVLKALDESGIEYDFVNFVGTFSMVDNLGNAEEMPVVWVTYSKDIVDQINWSGFIFSDVYEIADTVKMHPAFED